MTKRNDRQKSIAGTTDRELVVRRTYNATAEELFDAFTDRETIGHWWGPNGFRTTTHEMDVRPGGVWRFTMHGPDGTDYENFIAYRTVERPRRLEYDHGSSPEIIEFTTTVTFQERDGKTEITMRALFRTAEARRRAVEDYGALEGGKQTLARLADHVDRLGARRG